MTTPAWPQGGVDLAELRNRASQGDVDAQTRLGSAYANGQFGLKADYSQAVQWLRQAAEKGYAPAQASLGLLYEQGHGVTVDERQAFKYYLMAAEKGFAPAQANVGNMYAEGRGVAQDFFEANLWFRQAADAGVAGAQFGLGLAYELGRGLKQDEAQAARWYKVAAEAGSIQAQINYGLMLAEGRGGLAADPVQAYVWLSRAVRSGARPQARDALAAQLAPAQLSAANRILAEQPAGNPPARAVETVAAPAPASSAGSPQIVEQLREQSRRLAAQVESLTADKEAGERQAAVLAAQVRDLTQELDKARTEVPVAPVPVPVPVAAQPSAGDTAPSAAIVANLQRDNARLNDEVKRSTRELLALNQQLRTLRSQTPSSGPDTNATESAQLAAKAQQSAAEVERLEIVNKQLLARLATLEEMPKPVPANVPAAELAEARKLAEDLRKQLATLQTEKAEADKWARSLESNINELSAAAKVTETKQAELLKQLGQAQGRLKDRETDLAGQKQANTQLAETNKDLDQRLARAQQELKSATERKASPAAADPLRKQLDEASAQVAALKLQEKTAAGQLAAAVQDSTAAHARVAQLEKDLATARQQAVTTTSGTDTLMQQLAEAKAALDKSTLSVTQLTTAKEQLERDLKAAQVNGAAVSAQQEELTRARRDLADLVALREENIRLRQAAAGADDLAKKNAQLIRDNEQLTAFMNGNRSDLDQAQARAAELEKQLAEATTVRTEGGEGMRKLRVELDDANRTVDKLNGTVGELTEANEKLEKDLDSAQKSTAAALAAQSQAMSAASPDSYQMEIGTLNARIKQLEAQAEEERTSAAREVATLANQLQRTRETNRSLTEANRALVDAKDSETSATKDEISQLQSRIKELTAAGEELRRQGQAAAAILRTLTSERDDLRSQLTDARKITTTLPGLADEKAALQERLEAVGTELVQLQRDEEALQKANADLTTQLATSQEATEKAQADFAALQSKVTDAEKAADSHTASVAELTSANARLEQEKEDMRRLVESYRGDIARLNQNVRSSEQQRADAERGGQQSIDALTAQMTQLRRELEAARTTQARLTENYAAQDRDRSATIAQLRSDNAALTARLNQAQGTLDQIAAAARLGTPASAIASGGPVPVVRTTPVPASPATEMRLHTVTEGDSLSRISMRYYGTSNRWQEIYQANRDILQGSSTLRVGQQLRIP